ncbi:hypothetical protein DUNSADRAFT_10423 [Dunaliella salina]|uniref:Encoded protein n=1 Tax=Dunaliella salina TaxID=3046 RepID=A0ABQ7GFC0_DUNSA|nr:hypothetical protein DUNSADRAFT_10423 [Dunaliella salina]|eukprot:KAF5833302.1 hypothetical protein DUNSADRAFT_10423 [Dunaliella salina]
MGSKKRFNPVLLYMCFTFVHIFVTNHTLFSQFICCRGNPVAVRLGVCNRPTRTDLLLPQEDNEDAVG